MRSTWIAALADAHVGSPTQTDAWSQTFRGHNLDLVLIAGDMTEHGREEEFHRFATVLRSATSAPALAVLGNHDVQVAAEEEVRQTLAPFEISVLAGDCSHLVLAGQKFSVVGTKGYWGGWSHSPIGYEEPSMRACEEELRRESSRLMEAMQNFDPDAHTIGITHYVPTQGSLLGEPEAVHNFLGAAALGVALASRPVDVLFHGHAHAGAPVSYLGTTPTFNVALPARNGRPLITKLSSRRESK